MKSSKSTKAKPAKEEECGIWLDTKELKEKKQQLKGPISRLTVSFTQTKLNMPVTRQSIISSFFTHTHTDLNRSATHTGNKRKHGLTSDSTRPTSELDPQNRDGSSHKDQKEQRFFHLIRGEESEDEEPPEKRRHVAHYIQEYDQNVLKTHQNKEENLNKMVPETQAFFHGGQKATVKGRVLTPRPVNQNHSSAECETKASAMSRLGKENNWPESSPSKRRRVSSPAKCRLKEKHTLVSPEKCVSAGESLASLFTQDSEGLCVIAHRDRHSLTERRNSSEDNSHGYSVCVLVEEEEEMLFTQDSEGNMVIKH